MVRMLFKHFSTLPLRSVALSKPDRTHINPGEIGGSSKTHKSSLSPPYVPIGVCDNIGPDPTDRILVPFGYPPCGTGPVTPIFPLYPGVPGLLLSNKGVGWPPGTFSLPMTGHHGRTLELLMDLPNK